MNIRKIISDFIIPVAVAVILAVLIREFLIFKIIVPTASMYPTIKDNDQIMVTKVYNKNNLKRGDIVVFYSNELKEDLIKRLIGLPNDKINITDKGDVYVNGTKIKQDYVVNSGGIGGSFTVPEGQYFFLGDNRRDSWDARYWKNHYIEWKDIKGKGRFIIFPFNRIQILK